MKSQRKTPPHAAALRRRAEARVQAQNRGPESPADSQRLQHELQVHQIELEIQNEELRQTRVELEAAVERYADLCDFAPVGYLTLQPDGIIRQVNLTAASWLGIERLHLLNRRFSQFVAAEDRPAFEALLTNAFETKAPAVSEVQLSIKDKPPLPVQVRAWFSGDGQECWVVLTDSTERKRAEEELFSSREQLRALAARLQAVREEERTRVAREIHDVLAQELTRLKMDVVWLNRRLAQPLDADEQKVIRERLTVMAAVTDTAIRSVQKIATELRPVVLDSLGLSAAVEWQVWEFHARTGIACTATVPEHDLPLDRDRSTAMFRVLQESLTNVLRHAQATRVDVCLRPEGKQLVLKIRGNGCGIPPEALGNPLSIGLVGMRERALLLDGRIEIRSQPESGTTIEMRLPFSTSASQPERKS